MYRTLPTHSLRALRRAFRVDLRLGADADFCKDRLAIIATVLRERQRHDHEHDEELVPHAFNSRTPHRDDGIWCHDCEYHRDHAIHAPEEDDA